MCTNHDILPNQKTAHSLAVRNDVSNRTKAFIDIGASDFYTEKYNIPIQIKMRKTSKLTYEEMPNGVVISIPEQIHIMDNPDDYSKMEKYNIELAKRFIDKVANHFIEMGAFRDEKTVYSDMSTFKQLTKTWATKLGVPVPHVSMMPASKRNSAWGDFKPVAETNSGRVRYNPKLFYVPVNLAESVVAHEMVHAFQWYGLTLKYDNYKQVVWQWRSRDWHDKRFWDTLNSYIGDAKAQQDELETYYLALFKGEPLPSYE